MSRLTGPGGVAVVVVGLASALGGARALRAFESHATVEQCEELQSRYVSLLVKQLEPEAGAARRRELAQELEERWTEREQCAHTVTRSEATCALTAAGLDDMERCMR